MECHRSWPNLWGLLTNCWVFRFHKCTFWQGSIFSHPDCPFPASDIHFSLWNEKFPPISVPITAWRFKFTSDSCLPSPTWFLWLFLTIVRILSSGKVPYQCMSSSKREELILFFSLFIVQTQVSLSSPGSISSAISRPFTVLNYPG